MPEGLKEGQEEALEGISVERGEMSLAQVKDAINNIDTSRMPFVDSSMKKIKSAMNSPEVAKLIQIDNRRQEVQSQLDTLSEQIKIQETREDIKAA